MTLTDAERAEIKGRAQQKQAEAMALYERLRVSHAPVTVTLGYEEALRLANDLAMLAENVLELVDAGPVEYVVPPADTVEYDTSGKELVFDVHDLKAGERETAASSHSKNTWARVYEKQREVERLEEELRHAKDLLRHVAHLQAMDHFILPGGKLQVSLYSDETNVLWVRDEARRLIGEGA